MGPRAIVAITGVCALCLAARSDVLGPADLIGAANMRAAPVPRLRRQRGSVVLRARAPDARRRRPVSASYYFPTAGMFRVLGDFYPSGATPQLNTPTVYVAGTPPAPARLERDYSIKAAENMRVSLETIPAEPVAGNRTQLRFRIEPATGLEKYFGAWAHMLVASGDLTDMMHEHP